MGWHEDNPEWSEQVHAVARRLATASGADPDAIVEPWGNFTEADSWLPEAVQLVGVPVPDLQEAIEGEVAKRKAERARRSRGG